MATRRLLFVCTGNTCRSPLAEAIAWREALRRGLDVEVESAGTGAREGDPATDDAKRTAAEHDLDLTLHRARLLRPEHVAWADLVFVMDHRHLEHDALVKIEKASLVTADAVRDPIGQGIAAFRATYDQLEEAIRRIFDRIEERD